MYELFRTSILHFFKKKHILSKLEKMNPNKILIVFPCSELGILSILSKKWISDLVGDNMSIMKKCITLMLFLVLMVTVIPTLTPSNALKTSDIIFSGGSIGSFEEMLPGVFVKYGWETDAESYNKSYDSSFGEPMINYDDEVPGYENTTIYPYWEFYEIVDNSGNIYYIQFNESSSWSGSWNYSSYEVQILLDNDKSLVNHLESEDFTEPYELFYNQDDLTGDEICYTTGFYLWKWAYDYSYHVEYTWFNENMIEVDPETVIPDLSSDYEWASSLVGIYDDSDSGIYFSAAFDVYILSLANFTSTTADTSLKNRFTVLESNHFFEGMTVFNDTNGNGIADVEFGTNYYEIGDVAFSDVDKSSESELLYNFWFEDFDLGMIDEPKVNDGQIDWSVEILNLNGSLYPSYSSLAIGFDQDLDFEISNPEVSISKEIPVIVDSLKFSYHFIPGDGDAQLKIDQFVGNFTSDDSELPLAELEGLSLSLNYWSTIIQDSLPIEEWNIILVEDDEALSDMSGDYETESVELETGLIDFVINTEDKDTDFNFTSVEFGGFYTWGKDGLKYDVGTNIMPMFTFSYGLYSQPGMSDGLEAVTNANSGSESYSYTTYYYSSSYRNWDGYSIDHDPVFSAVSASKQQENNNTNGENNGLEGVPGFGIMETLVLLSIGGLSRNLINKSKRRVK